MIGWTRWMAIAVAGLCVSLVAAQDRATKVRTDKVRVQEGGFWIYNDLPAGAELAKQTGRPLLVVFRCIPCEHCAQLDERVVDRDPLIQALLQRFVCVRIVHANGMDLSRFQFDYDQSWAAFFLNADLTIYGRYGTRSHQTESESDMSLEGFSKALSGALELHQRYPANQPQLAGKHGPPSPIKVPEEFPSLAGKYRSKLDYEGQVVQSCIHCHQVGEALRQWPRSEGKPIPEQVLFPYPHPKSLGLVMDPKEKARVRSVTKGTPAEQAGFQAGDDIVALAGQPLLSIADMQWVFQQAGESATISAEVMRGGKPVTVALRLDKGWRRRDNISWRATSWDLRRMALGGLVLEDLPAPERVELKLGEQELGLRVKFVGQYNEHAAGKKAGFQKGDVLVVADGSTSRRTEGELMAQLVNSKQRGDQVPFTIMRDGQRVNLTLPIQ